jgi:hypothetical protein
LSQLRKRQASKQLRPLLGFTARVITIRGGSMSDKSVVEIYRAKNGSQAHLIVMVLDEAGIKAEIQGTTFNPGSATANNLVTESAVWWDSLEFPRKSG